MVRVKPRVTVKVRVRVRVMVRFRSEFCKWPMSDFEIAQRILQIVHIGQLRAAI